jgi:hypothetical protein
MVRCTLVVTQRPITIGSRSVRCSDCTRASAMRLTSLAPSRTAMGGIAALTMPRIE